MLPCRTLSLPHAALCTTIAAAAALFTGVLLGGTAPPPTAGKPPAPTPAPPVIGDPPLVYAELTKSGSGSGTFGPSSFTWEFTDGVQPIPHSALLAKLNIRPGARFDDASMVNAVANLGWDLISHSERAASTSADVQNGSSMGSGQTTVVEHWWFKRR